MTAITFARYDLVKVFRNRRFFLFTLGFPLVLFVVVTSSNKNVVVEGIPFSVYYLTGMVSWGTLNAVTSGGAVIALERAVGWTRQLRVTPLPVWAYMASKVVRGYTMAALTIIALYLAGMAQGVHLSASGWLLMTGLILVGLLPFAALGITFGHWLSSDSMGPALGGISALFALLGGAWFPLGSSGTLASLAKILPSYWLVQAGHAGLTHSAWPLEGWVVLVVWTLGLGRLALLAYRRDTGKGQ